MHLEPSAAYLPEVLGRLCSLPVAFAVDGETISHGRVYVAPPDRHLLIDGERIRLLDGARENHARPAIDPLFRSAAASRCSRVVGVLVSGRLNDGVAGLDAMQQCGGLAIIQEPAEASATDELMLAVLQLET